MYLWWKFVRKQRCAKQCFTYSFRYAATVYLLAQNLYSNVKDTFTVATHGMNGMWRSKETIVAESNTWREKNLASFKFKTNIFVSSSCRATVQRWREEDLFWMKISGIYALHVLDLWKWIDFCLAKNFCQSQKSFQLENVKEKCFLLGRCKIQSQSSHLETCFFLLCFLRLISFQWQHANTSSKPISSSPWHFHHTHVGTRLVTHNWAHFWLINN